MKKKTIKRNQNLGISAAFLLSSILLLIYFINNYSLVKKNSVSSAYSVDRPKYYSSDSAIPYYTLKWMENMKFAKKGLMTSANLQFTNEGKITRISFKHGKLNIDKEANVNYPFVARIELTNSINNKHETLYFSQARYEKAQIYRETKDGSIKKISWEDIKIGDYAKVEESVDLLISNTDNQNNFTDKYVKSLIIYVK